MDIPPNCPLDTRRRARDLYVKLFVVSFTVLYAYAQFMKSRRERLWLPRLVIAFFWPPFVLLRVLVPVAAFVFEFVRTMGDKQRLLLVAAVTLGSTPTQEELAATAATGPATKLPGLRRRRFWSWISLDVIGGLALAVQCSFSMLLFVRRIQRGAELVYDVYVAQMALAGLMLVLLLLTQTQKLNNYPIRSKHWMFSVRSMLRTVPDADCVMAEVMAAIFFTMMTDLVFGPAVASALVPGHSSPWTSLNPMTVANMVIGMITLILITTFNALTAERYSRPWWSITMWLAANLIIAALVGFSQWRAYYTGPMAYIAMLAGRHGLSVLAWYALDAPCPGAWTDPCTDWVWALG